MHLSSLLARVARTVPGVACLAALAGTAPFADANTITQSVDFVLNDGGLSNSLSFTPFDSAAGTLSSIQVDVTAVRRQDWGLWNTNTGTAQADIPYSASLTGAAFVIGGTRFTLPDLSYGPGVVSRLPSVSFGTAIGSYLANRSEFLAGQAPSFTSGYHAPTSTTTLDATLPAPTADGALSISLNPGTLNLDFGSGTWTFNGPGNVLVQSLTDLRGTAKLTYTYAPASVPETIPTGLALLATLGAGILLRHRLLRRGAPVG